MSNGHIQTARIAPVDVRALFPSALFTQPGEVCFSAATERSSDCIPGCLFAAIAGTKNDGAAFVAEAVSRGAAAILTDHPLPGVDVPQCIVPDVRAAYARLCAALAGNPSQRVQIAGVTGTNGKTTVTWLVRAMLRQAGRACGILGTVEYDDGVTAGPSALTTPDSREFSGWLARMAEHGTPCAAVELSSHALHQSRVAGTELAAAAVTNITQDHFDYHQTYDQYQASKARIMDLVRPGGVLMLNRDYPGSLGLRDLLPEMLWPLSFSLREPAAISARIISESLTGLRFRLTVDGATEICDSPLIGRYNIENCLAAAGICHGLGVAPDVMAAAIRNFRGAPGRLERIQGGQRFEVFVDYAHTEDALQRCLQALRSITPGRVICVFGAGGDRDRTKRPKLGRAAQMADLPIITSDNPRSEAPEQIAAEIAAGFLSSGPQPQFELDRAQAIRRAIQQARPGDSVLIAGKGHENEQIFRDHCIPFDDRREARQALLECLSVALSDQRIGA